MNSEEAKGFSVFIAYSGIMDNVFYKPRKAMKAAPIDIWFSEEDKELEIDVVGEDLQISQPYILN